MFDKPSIPVFNFSNILYPVITFRTAIREIDGRYYLGDSPLASSDVKNILTSNPIAYEMYSRGHNCVVGGTVVMSVGLTVEVIGLGVVIAEAMILEKPVISTDNAAAVEKIINEKLK